MYIIVIYICIYIYIIDYDIIYNSIVLCYVQGEALLRVAEQRLQLIHHDKFTVSFYNFKSQNFKLSVSNPKSKYVAYLSVLSQISNCQGLGRKNKHEILKTDRIFMDCIKTSSSNQHTILHSALCYMI